MKNVVVLLLIGMLSLTGCGSATKETGNTGEETKAIKVGVAPGPYGDLFSQAIKPELEKKGYRVEIMEFTDYVQPNLALANKEIDANLFQHSVYLNNFAKEHNLDISAVAIVPTAGAGVYSNKIKSFDELKAGDVVTVSDDVTNFSRALRILRDAGLISIKEGVNESEVALDDIENPKNIKIVAVEAPQTPRTLDSAVLAVVNGNYAISAGLDLSTALYAEKLSDDYKNVVVVRTEDVNSLGKDIQEAIASDAFKSAIENPNDIFKSFQKPEKQLY